MYRVKKAQEEEFAGNVEVSDLPPVVKVIPVIEQFDVDFTSEDLNKLRDKLNEVINHINNE